MTYARAVLSSAPVLYWPLDEAALLVRDLSGNGYDADLVLRPRRPRIEQDAYLDVRWNNITGSGGYSYNRFTGGSTDTANYTIASGDFVEYEVNWNLGPIPNKQIAFDYYCSNGWTFRDAHTLRDQNTLRSHPSTDISAYATNTWYKRRFDISQMSGAVIITYWLATEVDSPGTYGALFRNIRIVNGSTVKKTIFASSDPSFTPVAPTIDNGGSGTPGSYSGYPLATVTAHKAVYEGGIRDPNARSVGDNLSVLFSRAGEDQDSAGKVERTRPALVPLGAAPRTVEMWVFPLDANGGYLLSYGPESGNPGQSFHLSSHLVGNDRFLFRDGVNASNSVTISGAQVPAVGAWSHLAFTFADGVWTYYMNGTAVAGGNFTVPLDTADGILRVGQRQDVSTTDVSQAIWQGRIAHVAIYSSALSQQAIQQHYKAGLRESVSV